MYGSKSDKLIPKRDGTLSSRLGLKCLLSNEASLARGIFVNSEAHSQPNVNVVLVPGMKVKRN